MRITLAELVGHHHATPGALESCRQQLHVKHHRYIAGIAANARAALYHPKGDMRITLGSPAWIWPQVSMICTDDQSTNWGGAGGDSPCRYQH